MTGWPCASTKPGGVSGRFGTRAPIGFAGQQADAAGDAELEPVRLEQETIATSTCSASAAIAGTCSSSTCGSRASTARRPSCARCSL